MAGTAQTGDAIITLYGFGDGYDWIPTIFVENAPNDYVCSFCGLLFSWVAFLPCGHRACVRCYTSIESDCVCVFDSKGFEVGDVNWKLFSREEFDRFKIRCWNAPKGCEAVGCFHDIVLHFRRDCRCQTVRCLHCRKFVPHLTFVYHMGLDCTSCTTYQLRVAAGPPESLDATSQLEKTTETLTTTSESALSPRTNDDSESMVFPETPKKTSDNIPEEKGRVRHSAEEFSTVTSSVEERQSGDEENATCTVKGNGEHTDTPSKNYVCVSEGDATGHEGTPQREKLADVSAPKTLPVLDYAARCILREGPESTPPTDDHVREAPIASTPPPALRSSRSALLQELFSRTIMHVRTVAELVHKLEVEAGSPIVNEVLVPAFQICAEVWVKMAVETARWVMLLKKAMDTLHRSLERARDKLRAKEEATSAVRRDNIHLFIDLVERALENIPKLSRPVYWDVKNWSEFKEKALVEGSAIQRYSASECFFYGYWIVPGLKLENDKGTLRVRLAVFVQKGEYDSRISWPIKKHFVLTFLDPSNKSKIRKLFMDTSTTKDNDKHCTRPIDGERGPILSHRSFTAEYLELSGYVIGDKITVQFEVKELTAKNSPSQLKRDNS